MNCTRFVFCFTNGEAFEAFFNACVQHLDEGLRVHFFVRFFHFNYWCLLIKNLNSANAVLIK